MASLLPGERPSMSFRAQRLSRILAQLIDAPIEVVEQVERLLGHPFEQGDEQADVVGPQLPYATVNQVE
jgi:hypothetical protein